MKVLLPLIAALTGCHEVFDLTEVKLPDANPIDSFMPGTDCPQGYNLAYSNGSRYRIINASQAPGLHHAECAGDSGGKYTHLAVLETTDEQAAVQAALDATTDNILYVGAIQPMGQSSPRTGWVWLTGEDIALGAFDPAGSNGGEPNDVDGAENSEENVAYIRAQRAGLIDVMPNNLQPALCECDGRPIDPAAGSAYAANG